MPAKSKAQQRFMAMVYQCKKCKGECECSDGVKKAADSISKKDAKDMAKTKHDDLPTRVDEMAKKGGRRLKNMGKNVQKGVDTRTTPARNIVSSADTNRGGAHEMKKNYKRTTKHKGKMFEGTFVEYLASLTEEETTQE